MRTKSRRTCMIERLIGFWNVLCGLLIYLIKFFFVFVPASQGFSVYCSEVFPLQSIDVVKLFLAYLHQLSKGFNLNNRIELLLILWINIVAVFGVSCCAWKFRIPQKLISCLSCKMGFVWNVCGLCSLVFVGNSLVTCCQTFENWNWSGASYNRLLKYQQSSLLTHVT